MTTEQNTETKRYDDALSKPLMAYFVLTCLCVFGRESFLSQLGISETMYNLVRYGLTLFFILGALPHINRRPFIYMVFLEFFFGLSYLFSYLQGYFVPDDVPVYCITTLVIAIPCLACVSSVADRELLYKKIVISSYIISAIVLVYMYWPLNLSEYSMSASYMLVYSGAVHINEIFRTKKRKWILLVLSIAEFVTIFIKGARGPLFCLLVYILVKVFLEMRHNPKMLVLVLAGILFLFVGWLNLSSVICFLSRLLERAGLHSRTLAYILSKNILDDSGRGGIKDAAMDFVFKRPIIGYGAASDTGLIGGYPHSLPIELMFDFGIFIGSLIFILITICVIRTLFEDEGVNKDLKLIFLTQGYVMLFLSGSYLQSVCLFLFMGMVIKTPENKF